MPSLIHLLTVLPVLANAQALIKTPLFGGVYGNSEIISNLDKALPAAPKYTKVGQSGFPGNLFLNNDWSDMINKPSSDKYCGKDFSVYNVTYSDCSAPFLVGHCSQGQLSIDAVLDAFGRIPKNLRAAIASFAYKKGTDAMGSNSDNANVSIGGRMDAHHIIQLAVRAMFGGVKFVDSTAWKNAVQADSCVVDSTAAGDLNRTSPDYQTAGLRLGLTVAYNKITGKWPGGVTNTACLSNSIKVISDTFAGRFDTAAKCQNQARPVLTKAPHITLLKDYAAFDAEENRKPPASASTMKKWTNGLYPEWCLNSARSQRSSNDPRATCEIANLEVYNVTYSDCPQDPWTVCRCTDAQLTAQELATKFGRVPPGVRSHVVHIFALDGRRPDGSVEKYGGSNNDRFVIKGPVEDAVLLHESMHSVDKNFHDSAAFKNAYDADWCTPDDYSNASPAERFAQLGVWVSYDINGLPVSNYLNVDATCMKNQLDAVKTYAGKHIDLKQSKCFARRPNDKFVSAPVSIASAKFRESLLPPMEFERVW